MYKIAKQNISDIFSHPGSFIPTLGRHCTALNCTTTLELLLSYFRDLTKRRKIKRQKSITIVMSGKFQTPAMFQKYFCHVLFRQHLLNQTKTTLLYLSNPSPTTPSLKWSRRSSPEIHWQGEKTLPRAKCHKQSLLWQVFTFYGEITFI